MIVNQNPALVARMCEIRMNAFEKYIRDKKHPFLIDYVVSNHFFKIELRRDGLPHLHALLWVENPPNVDTAEGRAAVIDFIDKFLTTEIPNRDVEPKLYHLVRKKTVSLPYIYL